MVIRRALVAAPIVFITVSGVWAQDSTGQKCRPHTDPQAIILEILRGDPYDGLSECISDDGTVVIGHTRMSLADALKNPERQRIFNEDSSRVGSMEIMSNESGDARIVVLRTTNSSGGDLRYHSISLFRKSTGKWQIWLWHVGL